jgi:prepilin-type N-terminal cleavage/methylation domain-containing protein
MSRLRQIDGFTLIELVACIVILAVLAAIAGPRFIDNSAFSARGYAAEVVGALRAARQVAVASQCEVRFTIDAAGGYQAMQHAVPGNPCIGAWTVPVTLTNGNPLSGTAPSGVTLQPATQITFDKDGRAGGAVPLAVGALTITVDPTSGFVAGP